MKFQLKALVAALALTAAALPAQAAMTTSTSGDSSLVLTLIDNTNNVSATFDLGYSYSTFSSLVAAAVANGGTFSWDLSSLANYSTSWSTFTSTGNVDIAQWAVFAGDNVGSGTGTTGMITTYKTGSGYTATTQLTTSLTNFDTYISGNNAIASQSSVADGSSTSTSGASFAGAAKAYGTTGRVNATAWDATELLGSSMTIRQVLSGANAGAALSVSTLGNTLGSYTFTMSKTGVLTFTVLVEAVPEADSYAMLLAGLGLVGFAARRRNAK